MAHTFLLRTSPPSPLSRVVVCGVRAVNHDERCPTLTAGPEEVALAEFFSARHGHVGASDASSPNEQQGHVSRPSPRVYPAAPNATEETRGHMYRTIRSASCWELTAVLGHGKVDWIPIKIDLEPWPSANPGAPVKKGVLYLRYIA